MSDHVGGGVGGVVLTLMRHNQPLPSVLKELSH